MISLSNYVELNPGLDKNEYNLLEMKDCFNDIGYPFQKEIVNYLKNGKPLGLCLAGYKYDFVDGEKIKYSSYMDEDYTWSSVIIHYIEKYNLRLPKDVEMNIINKINGKGTH